MLVIRVETLPHVPDGLVHGARFFQVTLKEGLGGTRNIGERDILRVWSGKKGELVGHARLHFFREGAIVKVPFLFSVEGPYRMDYRFGVRLDL